MLKVYLRDKLIMAKKPKTTSEHLIAIYGYITGLKENTYYKNKSS